MTETHRWIWITGASSGIGRAFAEEAARRGARLVLSGRDADRLALAARACRESGAPEAHPLPFDLADPDPAVPTLAARTVEQLAGGAPDILVNNAGLGQRGAALETDAETERRLFAVNYFGPTALTRAVLPGMIARGRGRVAAVTSLLAKFGAPRRSTYAAAKHALHGWFDSLREEVRGDGVGVTLLVPGWVRTEISRRALEAGGGAHGVDDPGQQRGLPPEECARRMWTALARGRDEQLIGGWECLAAYGMRYCPRLTRTCLRRRGIG